jgi:hypothetical protein
VTDDERTIYLGFLCSSETAFELGQRHLLSFGERRFVLPALLPEQMPALVGEAWSHRASAELWVEFHYAFFQRALLERLLTQVARWSSEGAMWRDGIALHVPELACQLLVEHQRLSESSSIVRVKLRGQRREDAAVEVYNLLHELQPNSLPSAKASEDGILFTPVDFTRREQLRSGDKSGFSFKKSLEKRRALRVFISYAHEDELLKDDLAGCLKIIARTVSLEVWTDRQMLAGDLWEDEIVKRLRTADVVILLLSRAFFESDYCFGVEMEKALRAYEAGVGVPVPILLREVDGWAKFPVGRHQALPTPAKPLEDWSSADKFWANVQNGLTKLFQSLEAQRSAAR